MLQTMMCTKLYRKRADNIRGTMDFGTVRTIIGDDVRPDSFELIGEG